MNKQYFVYIITNINNTTLYIGVTNNLVKRIFQHKEGKIEGFTQKYKLKKLVYYEIYEEIEEAINREKRLKKWNREWKDQVITEFNPAWNDLYNKII